MNAPIANPDVMAGFSAPIGWASVKLSVKPTLKEIESELRRCYRQRRLRGNSDRLNLIRNCLQYQKHELANNH